MNLYTYVSNNPLRYRDPSGHWQEGDEKLSNESQAYISVLTLLWNTVDRMPGSNTAVKNEIHHIANTVRQGTATFLEANAKGGAGLGGKLTVAGVGVEIGGKSLAI